MSCRQRTHSKESLGAGVRLKVQGFRRFGLISPSVSASRSSGGSVVNLL